jgi:hypothetical protein
MSTPRHTLAVPEADGLGLGVGDGAGADVVGRGDGERDSGTRADVDRSGLAEPCGCCTGMRLGETSGLVVAGSESLVRSRMLLRAVM